MITIVGAGLAGSLLALELADRGQDVTLIDQGLGPATATALSYGLLPPGPAARAWQQLQRRHGPLGLRRRWLQLSRRGLPLPAWQVEPQRFEALVAAALKQAGVKRQARLLQSPDDLTALRHQGPLVLACGAGCRDLAPQLDSRLRCSWAGILELDDWRLAPARCRWPAIALLPERFSRLELEQRAAALSQDEWIVDTGLVPCGTRLLAGQITLVRPALAAGTPPDAALMEQRLRQALAKRWPRLAHAQGHFRQTAVSFCTDGVPLAQCVEPGLWVLAGFSGAFSQLPEAAETMAAEISRAEADKSC
ncbi:MAG: FAD-dependent oxidoreductase [Prochlorococcaceae cyanobacterium]